MTDETDALREALTMRDAPIPPDYVVTVAMTRGIARELVQWVEDEIGEEDTLYQRDLRHFRASLATPPSPPAPTRAQIEDVIAWAEAEWTMESAYAAAARGDGALELARVRSVSADRMRETAARLRAILAPPPLVIEPGRKWRSAAGDAVFSLEDAGDGRVLVFCPHLKDTHLVRREGGTAIGMHGTSRDIIAPWEDADDA